MLVQQTKIILNTAMSNQKKCIFFSSSFYTYIQFLEYVLMGFIFQVIAVFAAAIYIFKLNRSQQEVLLEAFALFIVERHCLEKSNC